MTQTISPVGAAPSVLGASDSSFSGGAGASGFAGEVGGVLVATGAGPGTLVLAITGIAAVILGLAARATGTQLRTRSTDHEGLPDLSYRSPPALG